MVQLKVQEPPGAVTKPTLISCCIFLLLLWAFSLFFLRILAQEILQVHQGVSKLSLYPVGLDAGKIKQVGTICGQESTRRIGDYKVKYGYTDIELLRLETFSCSFS